ncbi:hypothetical protein PPL_09105 [Heterostelium album PN500]|uniref:Uncharacterized protein n=1 Tax=Heterostelium pallidum (strain ATCC 26659 / Pp 5 / PN500) TaxID=670386 RepID=D3BKM3_HETP5|nr:hypothetical protein PPL_09105 [Heterostelium album PN500]
MTTFSSSNRRFSAYATNAGISCDIL